MEENLLEDRRLRLRLHHTPECVVGASLGELSSRPGGKGPGRRSPLLGKAAPLSSCSTPGTWEARHLESARQLYQALLFFLSFFSFPFLFLFSSNILCI